MVASKLAGVYKRHEIKVMARCPETIELVTFVAYVYKLAIWLLPFKFAGE